jgi:hypothetical protein
LLALTLSLALGAATARKPAWLFPLAGTMFVYYEGLTDYVRQKQAGARITVLNPGTTTPIDCWMSITNILANWENSEGLAAYQTSYKDYPWMHQYSSDRFWHVLLGMTEAQLPSALSLAQSRNAGWLYISDSADNAYNQVPVYWTAEAAAIIGKECRHPLPRLGRPLTPAPVPP